MTMPASEPPRCNLITYALLGFLRCLAAIYTIAAIWVSGAVFSGCAAPGMTKPNGQESGEEPPLIKDNTVVFFAISQADYDELVKQKPEIGNQMEMLFDYYHYADMIESRLTARGYTVVWGSWHTVSVQMAAGKIKKMAFNPADLKAILMKARGKDPEMVTDFSVDHYSIAAVISKYFGIKIDEDIDDLS